MQGKTHAVVGASCALLVANTKNIDLLTMGVAVATFGALMPDIDVKTSKIAKITTKLFAGMVIALTTLVVLKTQGYSDFVPNVQIPTNMTNTLTGLAIIISILIFGYFSPHRGATHSILTCLLATFGMWLLIPSMAPYMFVGYASHLVLDIINYKGIKLLYPLPNEISFGLCKSDGAVNSGAFVVGAFVFLSLAFLRVSQCTPLQIFM